MKKRLISIAFIIVALVLLVSCGPKEYTVTFDVDSGTPEIEEVKVKENSFLEIPEQPTKDGYNFDYWEVKSSQEKWDFGKDKVSEDMTLIARWKEVPTVTYDVTFYAVGGTPEPAKVTVNEGEKVSKPTDPTKDDHEFLGWYIVDTDTLYDFNNEVNEDLILTARWLKLEYVTVTFDAGEGTPEPNPQELDKGSKASKPEDPLKEGYTFLGWYDGEDLFDFSEDILVDLTLVAKYEKIVVNYTVIFNTGFEEVEVPDQVLEENEQVLKPVEPENPGYRFLGWYIDETLYDFDAIVTEDLTLTAKWHQEHVVTFISNEETNEEHLKILVLDGELATLPETEPERDFMTFLGWQLEGVDYDFSIEVKSDLTLIANWEEEAYIARAYIGEKDYRSIPLALEEAIDGDTILVAGLTHTMDFEVTANNLTFKPYDAEPAIIDAKISLAVGLDGVTFDGLEFTNKAQIHAPGEIDNFVFKNNKVADLTIEPTDYKPNNRTDVNAFIMLYTLSGTNVVGNVTITNNEFINNQADTISIARTSLGKEIIIEDNLFHNITNSSIRFDGGYNNGTYNLNNNIFKNDEGVLSMSSIIFRAYSSNEGAQIINVLNNEFINVGSSEMAVVPDGLYPGTAVIAFSTYNEYETNINIKNNIFTDTINSIHLRNDRGDHQNLVTVINNNTFNDGTGYYFFESNYNPARGETDFNLNKFVDGGVIITDPLTLAPKIINNENYDNIITE